TLRGKVLPIGGLKEKILAAHRGMIPKVLVPKENEKDIKEIPAVILKKVGISFVEHMDDVLKASLVLEKPEEIFKKAQEKDIYQKQGMPDTVPNDGIITH
ncbi:MAG: endopeptidase La, partial [Deltaproteobacteria bacterium]|nr:endopeptidase La [Deltaproteobacteria bacterium]